VTVAGDALRLVRDQLDDLVAQVDAAIRAEDAAEETRLAEQDRFRRLSEQHRERAS